MKRHLLTAICLSSLFTTIPTGGAGAEPIDWDVILDDTGVLQCRASQVRELEAIRKSRPEEALYAITLGMYHMFQAQEVVGNDEAVRRAIELFLEAKTLDPTSTMAKAFYGAAVEDLRSALSTAQKEQGLFSEEELTEAWCCLGRAHFKGGNEKEARKALETVLSRASEGCLADNAKVLLGKIEGGEVEE